MDKFRNPWWIVVGSVLGLMVGNGPVMQFTFGVFVKPLSEDLQADRASVSAALMAGLVATGIATLFAGRAIDRFGIRAVALPAIALFSLGMAAIGLLADSAWSLALLYAAAGIVAAGQTPLAYSKAVSQAFDRQRGLALGVAMAGVGLGTALMPQLAQWMVVQFGWRSAYVGLGLLVLVVAMPAMALLVARPKAAARAATAAAAQPLAAEGLTARQALGSAVFWRLAVAFFLVAMAASGATAHLVPLMTDRGLSAAAATGALGTAGMALIAGRLLAGWLLDRVHGPVVAAAFFALPLIGVLLLVTTQSTAMALPAAVLVGLGLGAEVDLIAYLQSRYLGLKAFGAVYGYLFATFMLGSGIGPFVMGSSFRILHSYEPALWLFAVALLGACLLMAVLGPYRYASHSQERATKPTPRTD